MSSAPEREGYIVAEGDAHKVEPTQRYFAELRASLKNALEVESELRAEVARLGAALAVAEVELQARRERWCEWGCDEEPW